MTPASPSKDDWPAPPDGLALSDAEVHVWRVTLSRAPEETRSLARLLSADEVDRAGRFHFQRDRDRFVVARATLRLILGSYLRVSPGGLRFRYSEFGKPSLAEDYGAPGLRFNLAHSNDLALCAVASGREVGVDVEFVRPEMAHEEIARHYFSPAEVAELRALPADGRAEAFFNCWTRKEAYIKARGDGLSFPLEGFTVSLRPGEPAALVDVERDPREVVRWRLMELRPAEGYAGAVAAEGKDWQLFCYEWQHPGPAVRITPE